MRTTGGHYCVCGPARCVLELQEPLLQRKYVLIVLIILLILPLFSLNILFQDIAIRFSDNGSVISFLAGVKLTDDHLTAVRRQLFSTLHTLVSVHLLVFFAGLRLILLLTLPVIFALTHPIVRRVGVERFAGIQRLSMNRHRSKKERSQARSCVVELQSQPSVRQTFNVVRLSSDFRSPAGKEQTLRDGLVRSCRRRFADRALTTRANEPY